MKNIIYSIAILAFLIIIFDGQAQTVNWRSIQPTDKHLLNVNTGWDYAMTYGIGYGYRLKTKIPLIIGAELSLPAGEDLLDDFKTKTGLQAEVFRHNHFSATVKVQGIFRRYASEFARLANFGSECSAIVGYYKSRWYASGEFGFDKAIVTHIRHSAIMLEYNPEIQSGWYIPAGGNFFYGVQAGYCFPGYDVYIKTGKTVTQDLKTTAAIPMYVHVGVNRRF